MSLKTLVVVDHLTGWPIARAIPDKEATTVANAVFEKLILDHGAPKILLSDNVKDSLMTLWPMFVKNSTLNSISPVLKHPSPMGRQKTSTNS